MPKYIYEADIEDLAVGAAILGTGGGGDPYLGKLMVQKAIRKNGPITLLDPSELDDHDFVIPTAMMGAPTVFVEKIPNGYEALQSLRKLEEHLGKKATATMPIECGGLNSTIPFVVASEAGIPIVDGDGMGRAFPELQMESFNVYGVSGTPMALHNERGDSVILDTLDNAMLEHIARGIAIRMGGVAHIAEYPMTGLQVKQTAIPNTISLAIEIGRAIREAKKQKEDPFEALAKVTESSHYGRAISLFKGKIVDLNRRTEDGFAKGTVIVEGFDDYQGSTLTVNFQNENLFADIDGEIRCIVPDLITFLDLETAMPITTESLRYGFRVHCIAIPTPDIMRSEAALKIWGPRYFGFDMDYVPVEKLSKQGVKIHV